MATVERMVTEGGGRQEPFRVAGHRIASGASARMIADQLGQSRVSMSLDFYLGRRAADPRVLAALEGADPGRFLNQSDDQSNDLGGRRDAA